jgi:hypothetical protein
MPVETFQVDGVTATIITNTSGPTVRRYVLLQKRYRDKNGALRPTQALYANDIPRAILAL